MLEAFLAAVRDEATDFASADGYRTLELVAATRLSLTRGEPIDLPLGDGATA